MYTSLIIINSWIDNVKKVRKTNKTLYKPGRRVEGNTKQLKISPYEIKEKEIKNI